MAAPQITALATPPSRQDPENFSTRADTFLGQLPTFATETNTVANYVNTTTSTIEDTKNITLAASTSAVGAANYKGTYSAGTTYTQGQSVSYLGKEYVAKKTNLGITPVNGTDWLEVQSVKTIDGQTGVLTTKTINGKSILGGGTIDTGKPMPQTFYSSKLVLQSSSSFVVPSVITKIRAYVGGKGGDGRGGVAPTGAGSGGGFAFGDIAVTPGETLTIDITAGVARLLRGATALLTANPGNNGSNTADVVGGTASIDASVTNGGAFSGGVGKFASDSYPGGGSAGSPLGNGFAGGGSSGRGDCGGGGIGGAGNGQYGGGAGGSAGTSASGGAGGPPANNQIAAPGRAIPFTDPLLAPCISAGSYGPSTTAAGPGAGGTAGPLSSTAASGGFGGGGGGATYTGGRGGELGGGGGGSDSTLGVGGTSLACGGGGAGRSTGGLGGPATVWIFY